MIKKTTFIRFMVLVVITLVTILVLKTNTQFQTVFYKYVYDHNISFASINEWYQSKFGSPLPFSKYFDKTQTVFQEQLKYKEASLFKDGVCLSIDNHYLVPSLEGGIVTFIGEKEGYGKTVIIEQANGIAVWYSNLEEINLKLYDYIQKGDLIGQASEFLYLVFYKDGDALDYKEYI